MYCWFSSKRLSSTCRFNCCHWHEFTRLQTVRWTLYAVPDSYFKGLSIVRKSTFKKQIIRSECTASAPKLPSCCWIYRFYIQDRLFTLNSTQSELMEEERLCSELQGFANIQVLMLQEILFMIRPHFTIKAKLPFLALLEGGTLDPPDYSDQSMLRQLWPLENTHLCMRMNVHAAGEIYALTGLHPITAHGIFGKYFSHPGHSFLTCKMGWGIYCSEKEWEN